MNSGRRDTEPHFPRVFFQYLYFNVQGISIEDQARDEYGNHSPTKDLIQVIGRILPCTGCKVIWNEDQKGGKEPQKRDGSGKKQTSESVSNSDRNTGSSAAT